MAAMMTISTGMGDPQQILVPISTGELIDKITILEIKQQKLQRPDALRHVKKELELLKEALDNAVKGFPASIDTKLLSSKHNLETINQKLWNVEDALRECEQKKRFGSEFVDLARSVYILNDERASLKRSINILCGSSLIEEKSYGGVQEVEG